MTEGGDLIVLDVDRHAAGNYTCQAANMAGFRQTPTANVWVYGKKTRIRSHTAAPRTKLTRERAGRLASPIDLLGISLTHSLPTLYFRVS